jgi:chitin synthase
MPRLQAPSFPESPFNNAAGYKSAIDLDSGWRRRQAVGRGETRKVKLTHGHFVAEYRVPTAIHNAMEKKYTFTRSTEFTYVSLATQ